MSDNKWDSDSSGTFFYLIFFPWVVSLGNVDQFVVTAIFFLSSKVFKMVDMYMVGKLYIFKS